MKKRNKTIYWIATVWLATGMVSTGLIQLLRLPASGSVAPPGTEGIEKLGYPIYFLTIIGTWKILGVIATLVPRLPLLKEWAYAGFFFIMSGAIFSHIAAGDGAKDIFPSVLLLLLTIISWYMRPADRKIVSFNFKA